MIKIKDQFPRSWDQHNIEIPIFNEMNSLKKWSNLQVCRFNSNLLIELFNKNINLILSNGESFEEWVGKSTDHQGNSLIALLHKKGGNYSVVDAIDNWVVQNLKK